jgi:thiol-disulfide isomerase/thioredoxin
MDKARDMLKRVVLNKQYMLVFIITLCFIAATLYTWRRFVSAKINPSYVANNEYLQKGSKSDVVDLYYFYTTWCPHCKKSMPVWQDFKSEIGDNKIHGYRINFVEVDCDNDKATADKFNVQGYPTIILVKGNQKIDYDAKPSKDTLMEFLTTSLK